MSQVLRMLTFSFVLGLATSSVQADFRPSPIPIGPIGPIPPIHLIPKEIPCTEALKPYFDWITRVTPGLEDVRGVSFMLVFNHQKNPRQPGVDQKQNVSGYSSGDLAFQGGNLVGDVYSYFSDRTYCNSTGSGFCVDNHPFNPNAKDLSNITISTDGKMTTILKSRGNAKQVDQLVCMDNGVIYAPSKLGQSLMSVITLQKVGFQSPR
jgi:hypothetical protein